MPPDLKVVVYGASGHGKVVAEVVRSTGGEVIGFVDDGVAVGTQVLDLKVLGAFDWLASHASSVVVALGVGANATRRKVSKRLEESGLRVGIFVHARACVSPSARLGVGTVVMAGAVVNAEALVGAGVIVNTGAIIEHECTLGDFAHVSPNAALGGGVIVGENSHIGLGASVRPFAKIGRDCVVGVGSVVLKGVADGATVAGVPARPLR
jgi:sugar O-acyltransferase (sialic acid O-acetyltransferase NeuD family)